MATFALTVALSWGLAVLMHWWPRFRTRWRRLVSLATSAAGVAFLVAGTVAEGSRQAATPSTVVLGSSSVTATASASASLHYYVLTAVCLLLGFAGLTFGETLSRLLSRRWVASAVLVAWLVTALRFLLERTAGPEVLAQAVGITSMAPIAGAWFASCLRREGRARRALVAPLWAYAYAVRGFVALVSVAATRLHLGTHYDVSPLTDLTLSLTGSTLTFEAGSWAQLFWLSLFPQLVVWPLYTVAAGLAGGLAAWRWLPAGTRRRGRAGLSPQDEAPAPSGHGG